MILLSKKNFTELEVCHTKPTVDDVYFFRLSGYYYFYSDAEVIPECNWDCSLEWISMGFNKENLNIDLSAKVRELLTSDIKFDQLESWDYSYLSKQVYDVPPEFIQAMMKEKPHKFYVLNNESTIKDLDGVDVYTLDGMCDTKFMRKDKVEELLIKYPNALSQIDISQTSLIVKVLQTGLAVTYNNAMLVSVKEASEFSLHGKLAYIESIRQNDSFGLNFNTINFIFGIYNTDIELFIKSFPFAFNKINYPQEYSHIFREHYPELYLRFDSNVTEEERKVLGSIVDRYIYETEAITNEEGLPVYTIYSRGCRPIFLEYNFEGFDKTIHPEEVVETV